MKTVFVILLLLNIILFIAAPLLFEKKQAIAPMALNSEKIILMPANDDCLQWGNFYEEQIQYATNMMAEMYPELSFEWKSIGSAVKYWLVISSLPNKEATNRMINKLRNFGIASFRVKKTEERWKNAISLGIYDDKQAATKQLEELEKKGIPNAMVEDYTVELKKIVIDQSNFTIKEQLQKIAEQFEGTQVTLASCHNDE